MDELRGRLSGADLGQALAAYHALGQLAGDDSRKVSDAAAQAIADASPQLSPEIRAVPAPT